MKTWIVFFQKGHTDGQQTWAEMLNIAKFSEKWKSKPQWGIISYLSKGLSLKCLQITNFSKIVETKKALYTVGRNVNCFSQYRKQYRVSSNTKNKIILWSSNSTLEPMSEENKNTNWKRYRNSVVVQWLGLGIFTAKDPGSILADLILKYPHFYVL